MWKETNFSRGFAAVCYMQSLATIIFSLLLKNWNGVSGDYFIKLDNLLYQNL